MTGMIPRAEPHIDLPVARSNITCPTFHSGDSKHILLFCKDGGRQSYSYAALYELRILIILPEVTEARFESTRPTKEREGIP